MSSPSLLGWCFLYFLLVGMPWLAVRSAASLRALRAGPGPVPTRSQLWASTTVLLAFTLLFAWVTAHASRVDAFAAPALGLREVALGGLALVALFAISGAAFALRPEEGRRCHVMVWLAPRRTGEWALFACAMLVAGVGQELAYRGVAMTLLTALIGVPWVAALVCSVGFAGAQASQGWNGVVAAFFVALVLHALVALTETLVVAMVVQATYNLVQGGWASRYAARHAPQV